MKMDSGDCIFYDLQGLLYRYYCCMQRGIKLGTARKLVDVHKIKSVATTVYLLVEDTFILYILTC